MWSVQYIQRAGLTVRSVAFGDKQVELSDLLQKMVPSFEMKSEPVGMGADTGGRQQTGTAAAVVTVAPTTLVHA